MQNKSGSSTGPVVGDSPLALEPTLISEARLGVRSLTRGEEVEIKTVPLDEFGNELDQVDEPHLERGDDDDNPSLVDLT